MARTTGADTQQPVIVGHGGRAAAASHVIRGQANAQVRVGQGTAQVAHDLAH